MDIADAFPTLLDIAKQNIIDQHDSPIDRLQTQTNARPLARVTKRPVHSLGDLLSGTSKNSLFQPLRKSDSNLAGSERGGLAWDSLVSSI
ncbi:hypothetical protein [Methylocystis sp.]|uniref:hypothetical protein n=1 Tax=Methylocystis sp. TaxID=1911079 RepID=UPI0025F96BE8|nr:hypothetical protein [Methylocystis sp.]